MIWFLRSRLEAVGSALALASDWSIAVRSRVENEVQ